MYVLPSSSIITRSIYCISVRVKRAKLVNASISLLARDPPSIVKCVNFGHSLSQEARSKFERSIRA